MGWGGEGRQPHRPSRPLLLTAPNLPMRTGYAARSAPSSSGPRTAAPARASSAAAMRHSLSTLSSASPSPPCSRRRRRAEGAQGCCAGGRRGSAGGSNTRERSRPVAKPAAQSSPGTQHPRTRVGAAPPRLTAARRGSTGDRVRSMLQPPSRPSDARVEYTCEFSGKAISLIDTQLELPEIELLLRRLYKSCFLYQESIQMSLDYSPATPLGLNAAIFICLSNRRTIDDDVR